MISQKVCILVSKEEVFVSVVIQETARRQQEVVQTSVKCHVLTFSNNWCWRRGSVVRTSVFGWRTFPDLCLIYS